MMKMTIRELLRWARNGICLEAKSIRDGQDEAEAHHDDRTLAYSRVRIGELEDKLQIADDLDKVLRSKGFFDGDGMGGNLLPLSGRRRVQKVTWRCTREE